jgi:hypothetical protein
MRRRHTTSDKENTENLSRRGFLRGMGGVAAGVGIAGAAGLSGAVLTRVPEKIVPTDDLSGTEKIEFFKKKFQNDTSFFRNAKRSIAEGSQLSRAEYVYVLFNTENIMTRIPRDIQMRLARVAPGIPAQESRYNPNISASRVGAEGEFQIMPDTRKDINKRINTKVETFSDADVHDFKKAGAMVMTYFDKVIYPVLADTAREVAHVSGLQAEDVNDFIVLCMVNAYNCGPTRMKEMLEVYRKKQTEDRRASKNETKIPTALSVFNDAVNFVYTNKLVKNYGKESSEYPFQVLAGAESIESAFNLRKEKIEREIHFVDHISAISKNYIGIPSIAGLSGAAAAAYIINPKRILTRRELGLTALLGIAGHQVVQGSLGSPLRDTLKNWWQAQKKQTTERVVRRANEEHVREVMYLENPSLVAMKISEEVKKKGSLFTDDIFDSLPKTTLPKANQTVAGVFEHMRLLRESGQVVRLTEEAIASAQLESVEKSTNLWVCEGIGGGTNKKEYMRLRPSAKKVLIEIATRFQKGLADAGLPNDFTVRPIVTSLVRTFDGTNKILTNAAPDSAHTYGLGIDLSDRRFQIVHKPTQTYITLDDPLLRDNRDSERIHLIISRILGEVLMDLHVESNNDEYGYKVVFTYEPNAVHHHVSVLEELKK